MGRGSETQLEVGEKYFFNVAHLRVNKIERLTFLHVISDHVLSDPIIIPNHNSARDITIYQFEQSHPLR